MLEHYQFFARAIDLPSPIISSTVGWWSSPPHCSQASYETQMLARRPGAIDRNKMESADLCEPEQYLILLIFTCLPAGCRNWIVSCSRKHVRRDVTATVTLGARWASAEDLDCCQIEETGIQLNAEDPLERFGLSSGNIWYSSTCMASMEIFCTGMEELRSCHQRYS